MDYCYQCRRHLNGALTCAGCGTAAEELRQHTPHAPAQPGAEAADDAGHETGHETGAETGAGAGDTGDDELLVAGHDRTDGRAEGHDVRTHRRRRTGPRRKRSKRKRRITAGVLGLVLAAAGLSLAQLAIESSAERSATSVKEENPVDFDGGSDASDGPADPAEPGDPAATGAAGTAGAADASASPSGSGDPSASASANASADASTSADDTSADPGTSATPRPTGTPAPGESAPESPGATTPADEPTSQAPPPPDPDPEPTPSESDDCTRIFWWCA